MLLFLLAIFFATLSPQAKDGHVTLPLHATRASPRDLEVSGKLPGLAAGQSRFIAYMDLLDLPQTTFVVTNDINFPSPVRVSGVSLDEIAHALRVTTKDLLIAAFSSDAYEAHYTMDYRAAHRPVLVLRINGKTSEQWSEKSLGPETNWANYGPYVITHPTFVARSQVLSQKEEAQVPWGVVKLEFLKQSDVLGAIAPVGAFAAGSPQQKGFEIALQSCYRCHNQGQYGGHKAAHPWIELSQMALLQPGNFQEYVRNPRKMNANAKMPGNSEYDDATLQALTLYFQTLATKKVP